MTCCSRFASVMIVRGTTALDVDLELEPLGFGDVAERPLDVVEQLREAQLADVDDDRARLDLRQVEDVVDQREQVLAGGVDRLGELRLLVRQVAVRVAATAGRTG